MTCANCKTDSGVYDLRQLCCAARLIDDESRATMRRLIAKAVAHGHDEDDIRAGLAEHRKRERKPVAGDAAR